MNPMGHRAYLLALSTFVFVSACAHEFDTTRVAPARGTLGEEIYKVLCERIASEENPADTDGSESHAVCNGLAGPEAALTPRLVALAENRDRLVAALDTVLPEDMEDDLQNFMVQLLPFYEPPEDYLPRSTRAIAGLLERLSTDLEALEALERIGYREGYRPLRIGLGVARPLLAYPRFEELSQTALDVIADDGVAHDELDQLLRATALEMATSEMDDPTLTEESTLSIARRLMYLEDDAFSSAAPRWVLRRDERGIAMVDSAGGAVPGPFADMDRDGLADVDVLGRYVDPIGAVLDVPAPYQVPGEGPIARDPSGRALRSDGTRYYAYFDGDRTMLAGLEREALSLFDPDTNAALNMMYGLPALMGTEVVHARTYGATTFNYQGPDASDGVMFDVLHAIGPLLGRPETDDALAVVQVLLRDHEREVAALIESGFFADRRSDMRDAALTDPSNLWDDLIQITIWLAQEPGLVEGLLRSFTDPRSARLGTIYGEMMRFRDQVSYDPSDINRVMSDVDFTQPVDRGRPDEMGNQSLFQRSISLIHDLSGVRMCNKPGARLVIGPIRWPLSGTYDECELLEIENVAEIFAESVTGRAELELKDETLTDLLDLVAGIVTVDDLLEIQTGIDGLTTSPTPEALARLVFAPRNDFLQNIMDPPPTRDGVDTESRHQATIFSWERDYRFTEGAGPNRINFYEAMVPMLEAFDDFDRRTPGDGITPGWSGDRFLFGEFISAIHLHWPSPQSDTTQGDDPGRRFYAHQSAGVSYEENVADLFSDGGFTARLHELSVILDGIEVRPGVDGISALAAATEALVDPDRSPGLAYRDGRTETTSNDGSRTIGASPLYQLLDGLNGMDAAFAAQPERHGPWLEARSDLVDQFLNVVPSGDGYRFENRRSLVLLRILVDFLRERVQVHRDGGDLDDWARALDDDIADSMTSPIGASAIRLADAIQTDDTARSELSLLMAYMFDEASGNDAFDATLFAAADMMMVLEDDRNLVPILRILADGIAGNVNTVVAEGGELVLDESAVDGGLNLIRESNVVDDRRTLTRVLQNLVALQPGQEETQLEILIDVLAEVNRAAPNAGTPFDVTDYQELVTRSADMLSSESRGMERLYDIIQNRDGTPPED